VTYYDANVYVATPDKFAHDECLPDDQFDTVMIDDFTTGYNDPVTGYRKYQQVPHRHQKEPWNWSPIYGAPKPCAYCGKPVR
jgi:hypothetical protein